ncbi:hypothetical protein [Casimicrobium huifangae]|uniref:hypothetical protein n=1 Tax=Casimicrobium huifangae TaxID=2591109 RepID=UPI0037838046
MKRFAELFDALDATTATSEKVALLRSYFAATPASDAAWAAYFLAGGKPRQTVRTAELRAWAQQAAGLPDWLFEECYQAVGDLAETIALVLPDALPIASADADRLPESGSRRGSPSACCPCARWTRRCGDSAGGLGQP